MSRQVELFYKAPLSVTKVICTGSFDDWKANQEMKMKEIDDQRKLKLFMIRTNVPLDQKEITFKFIVDGTWQVSSEFKKTGSGSFENNVLDLSTIKENVCPDQPTTNPDACLRTKNTTETRSVLHDTVSAPVEDERVSRKKKNVIERNLTDSGNVLHLLDSDDKGFVLKDVQQMEDASVLVQLWSVFMDCFKGRKGSVYKHE